MLLEHGVDSRTYRDISLDNCLRVNINYQVFPRPFKSLT